MGIATTPSVAESENPQSPREVHSLAVSAGTSRDALHSKTGATGRIWGLGFGTGPLPEMLLLLSLLSSVWAGGLLAKVLRLLCRNYYCEFEGNCHLFILIAKQYL